MVSLDTNVLLRIILIDVPDQTLKIERMFDNPSQTYHVADLAFAEVVWILQGPIYHYQRQRIADSIRSLLDIPHLNCNRPMLSKALDIYGANPQISFIDACLSIYAELNQATPLITLDQKLAKSLPKSVALLQ